MQVPQAISQPKILVIRDEFVSEMQLALEYAGHAGDDRDAIREQLATILEIQGIGAAILDTELDIDAAAPIVDALLELEIPFVFAGKGDEAEVPERVLAQTMEPALANLTVLGQSILGRPTYH
jgi:hypothetical protein